MLWHQLEQGDEAETVDVYGGLGEGKAQISEDHGSIPSQVPAGRGALERCNWKNKAPLKGN